MMAFITLICFFIILLALGTLFLFIGLKAREPAGILFGWLLFALAFIMAMPLYQTAKELDKIKGCDKCMK